MNVRVVAAVVACSVAPAFAEDLSPSQEEARNTFEEETNEALGAMNQTCGTKAKIRTDFANYNAETWSQGIQPQALCKLVLSTVESMCKDRPVYKKAIAKKLSSVSCVFAGVKPKQKKDGSNDFTLRNMSFAGGVFSLHLHGDMVNVEDNTQKTIEKALR